MRNCHRLRDPRPDDAEVYKGPGSLERDGYAATDGRARGDTPGNIVSRDRAARIEDFHREMEEGAGSMPFFPYDD